MFNAVSLVRHQSLSAASDFQRAHQLQSWSRLRRILVPSSGHIRDALRKTARRFPSPSASGSTSSSSPSRTASSSSPTRSLLLLASCLQDVRYVIHTITFFAFSCPENSAFFFSFSYYNRHSAFFRKNRQNFGELQGNSAFSRKSVKL